MASPARDPITYRAVVDDDIAALERVDRVSFGYTPQPGEPESPFVTAYRGRWGRVALDGDRVVGGYTAFDLEVTLPGGAGVAAPGVTSVAVAPSHRRRGILRRMMTDELARYRDDGAALALLTASEAAIYGRFGFGVVSEYRRVELDVRRVEWLEHPDGPGRFAMITAAEAGTVLPDLHDAWRRRRPGGVRRSDVLNDWYIADPPAHRQGASERFYAVHHGPSGAPTGIVVWRVRQGWGSSGPHHTADIEAIAVDAPVERVLWGFACELDLVTTVSAIRPIDDWLPWALLDRRAVRTRDRGDHLHARILDLDAVVSQCRFGGTGAVVVDVVDPQFAGVGGCWRIEGGPDGATAARTDATPGLRLGVDALATVVFGTATPSALAAAGRIEAISAAALRTADALFAVATAPFCDVDF